MAKHTAKSLGGVKDGDVKAPFKTVDPGYKPALGNIAAQLKAVSQGKSVSGPQGTPPGGPPGNVHPSVLAQPARLADTTSGIAR